MDKTVLILNGSPRPNGNTSSLVKIVQESLIKSNWVVNHINLYPLNYKGCIHCDNCKKHPNTPSCILQDDLTTILDQIVASDLVIIASPVYCFDLSGCLSTALDRWYSFFKPGNKNKKYLSLIADKKMAGIFTSGSNHFSGMDLCVEILKKLCLFANAKYIDTLSATYCDTPGRNLTASQLQTNVNKFVEILNMAV